MVHRLVDEAMNGRDFAVVDELFSPVLAERVKRDFVEFATGFPDWREEIVQLVAEENLVAGRLRCSGTGQGRLPWLDVDVTGRRQEVDEVFFLREADGKFVEFWALEDNW